MVDDAVEVDECFLIEAGKDGQHGHRDRDGEVEGEWVVAWMNYIVLPVKIVVVKEVMENVIFLSHV